MDMLNPHDFQEFQHDTVDSRSVTNHGNKKHMDEDEAYSYEDMLEATLLALGF